MANAQNGVLIVEDSVVGREKLELALADECEVLPCATVDEARRVLRREAHRVAVALLDYALADGHGIDLLRDMQGDPLLRRIPVLVLAADGQAEVRSLDAGAVGVISKPYPPADVIRARVRRTMELCAGGRLDAVYNMSNTNVAEALSSDYCCIYYVNVTNGRYIEYSASDEYRRLGIEPSGDDFFGAGRQSMAKVVYADDQRAFLSAFTRANVLEVPYGGKAFTLTYRLMLEGVPTWVSMKVIRMRNHDGSHIIVAINDVDAQIRQQEWFRRTEQERMTYARIARALARDYFTIYVVDPTTKRFLEYGSSDQYDELGVKREGDDFFNLSRLNAREVLHPEDIEMFLAEFTEQNLMAEMERNGSFTLKYRLLFDGNPAWVSMKATLVDDEHGRHIIIGVNNIDAQVRREQEYSHKLVVANERANRDPLTGVKSKHVFLDKLEQVNEAVAEGRQGPFSVVMCDINGLKQVNDTKGHAAGDQLIRDAAAKICRVFKHSPVYRVGGDEFAVVSEGQDFQNIDELVEGFLSDNEHSASGGGFVIACGLAKYDGSEGADFDTVFREADAKMYENKKTLKA